MSRKGNKQSITIYSNEPLGDPDSSIVHLDII